MLDGYQWPVIRSVTHEAPAAGMTPEQVAWANMETADRHHQLQLLIAGAEGWFALHPEATFQELERGWRQRNMHAHLIAVPPRLPQARYVTRAGTDAQYECIYSCRPREAALAELRQHAASYEENYERLAQAGSAWLPNQDATEDVSQHKRLMLVFDAEERERMKRITGNQLLVKMTERTMEEHFARLANQWPDHKLCAVAIAQGGCPIMASFSGSGELISDVGFLVNAATRKVHVLKIQ